MGKEKKKHIVLKTAEGNPLDDDEIGPWLDYPEETEAETQTETERHEQETVTSFQSRQIHKHGRCMVRDRRRSQGQGRQARDNKEMHDTLEAFYKILERNN